MIVFVYGSLKKGFGNHRLLESSTYLGEAITTPEYTMLNLGMFPGVVYAGDTPIKGELYVVDSSVLDRLDQLEGHPSFYQRTPIEVTMADGTVCVASIYLLPEVWMTDHDHAVHSGDWSNRA